MVGMRGFYRVLAENRMVWLAGVQGEAGSTHYFLEAVRRVM